MRSDLSAPLPTPATTFVIGVDFGSSRIKVAAYCGDGSVAASAERETPRRAGADGDDFLVLPMLACAADAIADLALGADSIAAVGISSMGEVGTLLVDDQLIDLAFPSWYDDRGQEVIAELEQRFGADELLIRTGGHARVTSTVAKLGSVAAGRTEQMHGAFLGLCGALAWQLTGEAWQERGLAVTSGVYDWAAGDYVEEIWHAAGLSRVDLPTIRPAGHSAPAAGALAARLGLRAGAPVVIAGHDHPVAAVGAGLTADEIGDSMGTGEALIAVMTPSLSADIAHCRDALRSHHDLTFEIWPATGERLVVWERMRPGLAMRTFLESSGLDRAALDYDAPPPRAVTPLPQDLVRELERGRPVDRLPPTPVAWAQLIDHYVVTAGIGEKIVRDATGAEGGTVLTGGGLRSARWRHSKVLLATSPQSVSTVKETVTRGAAAIAGAALDWWPTAESMPGAERVHIRPGCVDDMDRAAAALSAPAA